MVFMEAWKLAIIPPTWRTFPHAKIKRGPRNHCHGFWHGYIPRSSIHHVLGPLVWGWRQWRGVCWRFTAAHLNCNVQLLALPDYRRRLSSVDAVAVWSTWRRRTREMCCHHEGAYDEAVADVSCDATLMVMCNYDGSNVVLHQWRHPSGDKQWPV